MGNGPLVRGYEFFLAVLLPVAVGAIALVPLDHFFQHALEQDHLDNHAVLVDERHMHRTTYLRAQRKQRRRIQQAYEDIAEDRANSFVEQVRTGDSPLVPVDPCSPGPGAPACPWSVHEWPDADMACQYAEQYWDTLDARRHTPHASVRCPCPQFWPLFLLLVAFSLSLV